MLEKYDKKAYAVALKEAKKEKSDAKKRLSDKHWMAQASDMSKDWAKRISQQTVEKTAKDRFEYWKLRAHSGFDKPAQNSWALVTGEGLKHKPRKVTQDSFYYNLPKNKFYILRKLSGTYVHLYPPKDFDYPRSFSSESSAKKYIEKSHGMFAGMKIFSGTQASKYPVPKRY
jgi:hypothetical protein